MAQDYETGVHTQQINFTVKSNGIEGQRSSAGAIGALERISDIEALYSATKGLDILQKTAKAGGPTVQRIVDGGANKVVDVVSRGAGIDGGAETVFGAINSINPSAVNNAVGAAEDLLFKIENDEFEVDDIPRYARDFVGLVKTAGKIITGSPEGNSFREVATAPNYAQTVLSMGNKMNHRFLVSFGVNPDYADSLGTWDLALMIKQSERPSVEFEYKDINCYNFRTKMPTRTIYQPINMTFYDDEDGQTASFLNMYLKLMSPISNITPLNPELYDIKVMDFLSDSVTPDVDSIAFSHRSVSSSAVTDSNSSSLGYLTSTSRQLLHTISLYHIYKGGSLMDVYTLANPRFTQINMSELTPDSGEAATASVTIDYDAVNIQTWVAAGDTVYKLNKGYFNDLSLPMVPENFVPASPESAPVGDDRVVSQLINEAISSTEDERSLLQKTKSFVFGSLGIS